jgi:hypothetical protein
MHTSASMKYMSSASVVDMQRTGQTSKQEASLTPMHGSVITKLNASPYARTMKRSAALLDY